MPLRITLLVVLRHELVRVDFNTKSGFTPTAEHVQPRGREEGLTELVERAAQPGGKLRGSVWVLSDESFCQTLDVAAKALRNADDEDITRALAYEAQLLWGIPATDSALGWRRISNTEGSQDFWVVAMSAAERDALAQRIKALGGELAGIVHPVAVPRALEGSNASAWKRVEFWADLRAELSLRDGVPSLSVRRADPTRSARDERLGSDASEVLIASPAIPAPNSAQAPVLRLTDEAVRGTWLAAWAATLAADSDQVPVIRPQRSPLSLRVRALGVVAGLLLVGSLCGFDYGRLRQRDADALAELQRANEPAAKSARLETQRRSLDSEATALEAELALQSKPRAMLGWEKNVPADILEAMALGAPEDLAVRDMEICVLRSSIRGQCASAHAPNELSAALARGTESRGYRVSPSRKSLRQSEGGGSLYDFEILIEALKDPLADAAVAPIAEVDR